MKRIIITIIFIIVTQYCFSQFHKNNFFISGNMSFTKTNDPQQISSESNISKIKEYSILPGIRYYYNNNSFFKIDLGYKKSENDIKISNYSTNNLETSSKILSIGLGKSFRLFQQLYISPSASFIYQKSKISDKEYTINQNNKGLYFTPEFNYFLSKYMYLSFAIGELNYMRQTIKPNDGEKIKQSEYGFVINTKSVSLGLNIKL